jgi:hypothetical protein
MPGSGPASISSTGELCVRGPQRFDGYLYQGTTAAPSCVLTDVLTPGGPCP